MATSYNNVLLRQYNGVDWDSINLAISAVTGLQNALDGKANLDWADFTGPVGAPLFRSATRRIGQFITSSPGNDFGPGRTFVRLWETSTGAGFISGKISISGIWSYSAIMGVLEIETGVYVGQGSTSISYGNSRLTSVTSTAKDNLRIGNIEVVGGYVGFYVYSQNTNNININYDLNVSTPGGTLLWTNTSWESIALPAQRTIEFQTDVKINGQYVVLDNDPSLTNARPASDVYAWAKAANPPTPATIGAMPTSGGTFTNDVTIDTTPGGFTSTSKNLIFKYNRGTLGGGITQKSLYVDSDGVLRYDGAAISLASDISSLQTTINSKAPVSTPTFTTSDADFAIGDVAGKIRIQSHSSGIPIRFLNSANGFAAIAVGEIYLNGSRAVGTELDNALNVGNPTMKFNTSTAYTLVLADKGTTIFTQASSATTITIPTDASVAFPNGTEINVVRYNSQDVTIGYASGVTIYSEGSSAGNAGKRKINAEYQAVTIKKVTTNTWILIGALKA